VKNFKKGKTGCGARERDAGAAGTTFTIKLRLERRAGERTMKLKTADRGEVRLIES